MEKWIRRSIVIALEKVCDLQDRLIPWWYTGCWLAVKSASLDERWETDVWKAVDTDGKL